ncbi:hypothetical protein ABK040_011925 [Willaertia magna]
MFSYRSMFFTPQLVHQQPHYLLSPFLSDSPFLSHYRSYATTIFDKPFFIKDEEEDDEKGLMNIGKEKRKEKIKNDEKIVLNKTAGKHEIPINIKNRINHHDNNNKKENHKHKGMKKSESGENYLAVQEENQPKTRRIPVYYSHESQEQNKEKKKDEQKEEPKLAQSHIKEKEEKHKEEGDTVKGENFLKFLNRKNLRRVRASPNGNCLFNAISLALFQTEEYHYKLRQLTVDWISKNLETIIIPNETGDEGGGLQVKDLIFLKSYHESYEDYLREMSQDQEWADYACINALSNILNLEIDIYYVSIEGTIPRIDNMIVQSKVKVLPISMNKKVKPKKIRLEYNEGINHYNLLVPNLTSML